MRRTATNPTQANLIAPCGIDCGRCRAHLRLRNPCPGCRVEDVSKPKTRVRCLIKNCEQLASGGFACCAYCDMLPCESLAHLDQRYRSKYGTSVIESLFFIRKRGVTAFVNNENKRWACPRCGSMLCMHEPACLACGYVWRE